MEGEGEGRRHGRVDWASPRCDSRRGACRGGRAQPRHRRWWRRQRRWPPARDLCQGAGRDRDRRMRDQRTDRVGVRGQANHVGLSEDSQRRAELPGREGHQAPALPVQRCAVFRAQCHGSPGVFCRLTRPDQDHGTIDLPTHAGSPSTGQPASVNSDLVQLTAGDHRVVEHVLHGPGPGAVQDSQDRARNVRDRRATRQAWPVSTTCPDEAGLPSSGSRVTVIVG